MDWPRALVGCAGRGATYDRPDASAGRLEVLSAHLGRRGGRGDCDTACSRRARYRRAAAYGLALGAGTGLPASEVIAADAALARLGVIADRLRSTRPTAVNLAWALERLLDVAERHLEVGNAVSDLPARLLEEAHLIYDRRFAACRRDG